MFKSTCLKIHIFDHLKKKNAQITWWWILLNCLANSDDERGGVCKIFGSWGQKLREPGACVCILCAKKIIYATSGKKVIRRHKGDPAHKATVLALQQVSRLPGATTTANVAAPMRDRTCDIKICVLTFIAEHDFSFTIAAQPLFDLCKTVAKD